jgi:hypothetical protein
VRLPIPRPHIHRFLSSTWTVSTGALAPTVWTCSTTPSLRWVRINVWPLSSYAGWPVARQDYNARR